MWLCRILAGDSGRELTTRSTSWVLTSYLVSNAIVLPISGWLANLFGRKRFFLVCIFVFTVSSLLCGIAPSLAILILFRVIQGVGGGGLQPMAQAILADTFPPQKRGLAFALYGITAIMAPTIGPTSRRLDDRQLLLALDLLYQSSRRNPHLPLFLVFRTVEDPPYLQRDKSAGVRIDYIGIALLALGVGALQILLDKGQEDDWFGSPFIIAFWRQWRRSALISLVLWELA